MTSAYETGAVPQIEVRHRMRIAREFAGLEQEELAERMGVTRSTISNAENGKGAPRRTTINAWALACGVPASWILTGKETPPPGTDGPDGGSLLPRMDSNHQPSDCTVATIRPSIYPPANLPLAA